MPGLFDRLQAKLGDDEQNGVTPLEIAGLPDPQRRILLWLLRDRAASTKGATVETVKAKMNNPPEDCEAILTKLAQEGWVITMGEPPSQRYKVNLRRKRGSSLGFGLWSIVSDRLLNKKDT